MNAALTLVTHATMAYRARLSHTRTTLHVHLNIRLALANHALISYKAKREMQKTQCAGQYCGFAWQLNNQESGNLNVAALRHKPQELFVGSRNEKENRSGFIRHPLTSWRVDPDEAWPAFLLGPCALTPPQILPSRYHISRRQSVRYPSSRSPLDSKQLPCLFPHTVPVLAT